MAIKQNIQFPDFCCLSRGHAFLYSDAVCNRCGDVIHHEDYDDAYDSVLNRRSCDQCPDGVYEVHDIWKITPLDDSPYAYSLEEMLVMYCLEILNLDADKFTEAIKQYKPNPIERIAKTTEQIANVVKDWPVVYIGQCQEAIAHDWKTAASERWPHIPNDVGQRLNYNFITVQPVPFNQPDGKLVLFFGPFLDEVVNGTNFFDVIYKTLAVPLKKRGQLAWSWSDLNVCPDCIKHIDGEITPCYTHKIG